MTLSGDFQNLGKFKVEHVKFNELAVGLEISFCCLEMFLGILGHLFLVFQRRIHLESYVVFYPHLGSSELNCLCY
jgi:hypothetical protein